jgi:hypothetical protein
MLNYYCGTLMPKPKEKKFIKDYQEDIVYTSVQVIMDRRL